MHHQNDWFDNFLVGLIGAIVATGVITIRYACLKPPTPTTMHLFMSGDSMCCKRVESSRSLDCGRMHIQNASNYVDSKQPCEHP